MTLSAAPQPATTSPSGSHLLPDHEVIDRACLLLDRAISDHHRAQLIAEMKLSEGIHVLEPHERWELIVKARRMLAEL